MNETFFSFTVLQMTMQVNWAGETEMKILSNEWILFFVILDLAFLPD